MRWHRRQRRETAPARRSWPQATRISANLPAPVARRGAFPEGIGTMGIVIGTRGSALALAQARIVADRLDGPVELRVIRTAGDATAAPLSAQAPPAPGQGALAVQCRGGDAALATTLARLDHAPTRRAVTAERALLQALGASCALALGAHARVAGGEIVLEAALATDEGVIRATARGADPLEVAARAAPSLREPAHA